MSAESKVAAPVGGVLAEISELCQQGLNSENPAHWEAALQDILDTVHAALARATGASA